MNPLKLLKLLKPLSRDDQIRTGDPFVPNEVRYQLRYIPIHLSNKLLLVVFLFT